MENVKKPKNDDPKPSQMPYFLCHSLEFQDFFNLPKNSSRSKKPNLSKIHPFFTTFLAYSFKARTEFFDQSKIKKYSPLFCFASPQVVNENFFRPIEKFRLVLPLGLVKQIFHFL